MSEMLQEVYSHHCSGAINNATDEWLPQWRHLQSLFQFVLISDTCFVHFLLQ